MSVRASKADWLRHFACEERGLALLEFAFVLPFLVLLFIGGFQLMDAISAYRKVGSTVRTLADLTTQNTTITASQADEILNASRQVMAPYSPSSASMRISQIQVDGSGRPKISWSRALNGTAYSNGTTVIIPNGLAVPNSYYILSEMNYTYTPTVASSLIGTIPLKRTIYMSPRNSEFVAYN